MKFTTTKKNLLNVLQKVSKVVPTRTPLPVLEGILFEVQSNQLTTAATDLDVSIRCATEVNGLEDGSIVLPSRYITEIVKRLPEAGDIEMESDGLKVCLRYRVQPSNGGGSQLSEAVIQGIEPDSFPSLPFDSEPKHLLFIKAGLLSEALKQILFAVSSDESRPVFTGVLLHVLADDQGIRLVATDCHRIAYKTLPSSAYESVSEGTTQIIVPGRNLLELSKILNQSPEDDLEISLGDNQVFFVVKEACPTIIISRLIAGQYPAYQTVIPEKFEFFAGLKTNELKAAVERSMIFSENIPFVGLGFEKNDGSTKCIVSTVQEEIGGIREVLPLTFLSGDPQSTCIYFNARYLAEALRAISAAEICLKITGPLSPMVMHPVADSPDPQSSDRIMTDYFSLSMPIRYEELKS